MQQQIFHSVKLTTIILHPWCGSDSITEHHHDVTTEGGNQRGRHYRHIKEDATEEEKESNARDPVCDICIQTIRDGVNEMLLQSPQCLTDLLEGGELRRMILKAIYDA